VNAADFDGLFDHFTDTVLRVEAGRHGAAGGAEAERVAAFLAGAPRPERSVRTSPWLARIATSTVAGKSWTRLRVVDDPLTDYQRYQMQGYVESQAAGDQVRIAPRAAAGQSPDFWLFDAATDHAHAVLMRYDDNGALGAREPVTDRNTVAALADYATELGERSVPLNVFLAASAVAA
jgi:hypothetical protein